MMKVLVLPRNETNPYQDLLYGAMSREEVEVAYMPMPTRSHTINVLLFPVALLRYRLRGYRILHVHWTYLFAPVWIGVPGGRRLMQWWYRVFLSSAQLLGYRIVWTAHNLLPLSRVFSDDAAARRRLASSASAVVVHNKKSVAAVEAFGARTIAWIPFGPYGHYAKDVSREEARNRLGIAPSDRVVAFVGAVEEYKGVDLLLEAVRDLGPGSRLRLVVAGSCSDRRLRRRVRSLAEELGERALTRLEYIPDDELQIYLRSADAAALPFRFITNSSSLLLALDFGLPVVIPALPALGEVPAAVAVRYEPSDPGGLRRALECVEAMADDRLLEMSAHARAHVADLSWERTARETIEIYRLALDRPPPSRDDPPTSTGTPASLPQK